MALKSMGQNIRMIQMNMGQTTQHSDLAPSARKPEESISFQNWEIAFLTCNMQCKCKCNAMYVQACIAGRLRCGHVQVVAKVRTGGGVMARRGRRTSATAGWISPTRAGWRTGGAEPNWPRSLRNRAGNEGKFEVSQSWRRLRLGLGHFPC